MMFMFRPAMRNQEASWLVPAKLPMCYRQKVTKRLDFPHKRTTTRSLALLLCMDGEMK